MFSRLVIYINNKHIVTDINLNDGRWNYLCFTWNSTFGSYNFYLNGNNVRNGTRFAQGTEINPDGKLVIGQEQDMLGGRFSQSESFLGKLAHLDVWDKILTPEEIQGYMLTCEEVYGNLFAWPEFMIHVKGDVNILPSTFCQTCEEPKSLLNGKYEVNHNVAWYSCNPGYSLINPYPNGRKCTKAAKWEGTEEPTCKRNYINFIIIILYVNLNKIHILTYQEFIAVPQNI